MKRTLRIIAIIIQYVLNLIIILVGLSSNDSYGQTFTWVGLIALMLYPVGTYVLVRSATNAKKKIGYWCMIVACLPTVPLSLLFGVWAAHSLAADRGVIQKSVVGEAGGKDAAQVPMGEQFPKKYYPRKLYRIWGFYISLIATAIGILFTIKYGRVPTQMSGAVMVLIFGWMFRKPTIVLTRAVVETQQLGRHRSVLVVDIVSVDASRRRAVFLKLKDGTEFPVPRAALSGKTMRQFTNDLASLMRQNVS